MKLKEYISIHVTFSVLHSWITYFVIFNLFNSVYYNKNSLMPNFLLTIDVKMWGVIAMVVMLVEMCIYLAYYKDIIFSTITLVNYVGMFLQNKLNHKE